MGNEIEATECQRCLKGTPVTMSRFNTQMLCEMCLADERVHHEYQEAHDVEEKAVLAKEYNYPGIGLPADLRKKMFDRIIASEKYDGLFRGAIWGMNDGMINVDKDVDLECLLCQEKIPETYVNVSDVDGSEYLCLKCGKLFILHAKKVIEDWLKNELDAHLQEVDKAMAEESIEKKKP